MEEFAIGANLESAAARGNERERLDALAEFKNFGRQTDGLRRVVSNDAVFDRHFGLHFELLSKNETIGASKRGQDTVVAQFQFRADDFFSTDTSVALIIAKTASPLLRFIRLTEPVVMIEVAGRAAVLMTIFETTLSDTIVEVADDTPATAAA